MSLHAAAAVAGELIAVTVAGLALMWARRRWLAARYKAGPGETTQHSSTQDD